MAETDDPTGFIALADGTIVLQHLNGDVHAVQSETDAARLATMPDAEIERHAAGDPDHPALDDAFWASAADIVRLDADVSAFYRARGDGFEARINAVLRRSMRNETA